MVPHVNWRIAGRVFRLETTAPPILMGVVNTTPDSFSDGGRYVAPESAIAHALRLVDEGAHIIDIGGESTRPGSAPISLAQELARVLPVVESLRKRSDVMISIDTSKAEVARQAIACGAQIVNDVTGLRGDPAMLGVAARCDAGLIVMHMAGVPQTMQIAPEYRDVVAEVATFLESAIERLVSGGIDRERIAIDPGIGFGKTAGHNLALIHHLGQLSALKRPICLGVSRKNFIGQITGRPVDQRTFGTIGAALAGYVRGASILRIHDVAPVRDAVAMARAIEQLDSEPYDDRHERAYHRA